MKKYEIVYIIHPDLEGSIDKITEKVKNVIVKSKGTIVVEEDWGKKKLAYEINKSKFGMYEFLSVEIEPAKIKEVERTLKISEEIIRSMIVLSEEGVETIETSAKKKEKTEKAVKKETIREEKKDDVIEKKEEKEEVAAAEKTKPVKTKSEDKKEEKTRLEELDKKLKEIIGQDES